VANVRFESAYTACVLRHFRNVTGITPTLPPALAPIG
jgi:hypothetical protein